MENTEEALLSENWVCLSVGVKQDWSYYLQQVALMVKNLSANATG